MTESPSAERGWAWCGSLNSDCSSWLGFSLFCFSFTFTRAPGLTWPLPCSGVCLQQCSLPAHQGSAGVLCQAAWTASPPAKCLPSGTTNPQCSESSCQQLCVLVVCVCALMEWAPSLPSCLEGTPGPCEQCPTPLDHSTVGFPGLDSLLPIAVGWELAGLLQSKLGP